MRILFLLSIFSFLSSELVAQTYSLTVNGGYGSGNYQAGDTVHIWCKEYDTTQTFSNWTGDVSFLESDHEWHTQLVMPSQAVNVSAHLVAMPSYTISHEQIMGQNNLKSVYSCFPVNQIGVAYLFHGTGGSATNWVRTVEYRSFVDAMIEAGFGVIITEAEEITLNTDLNNDGNLRWQPFPLDVNNGIDYLNIKAITDTFINRNKLTNSTPLYSVGMSNGGAFSAAISYGNNYVAGVSYCASSASAIFDVRNNAFAFRMARWDDNAQVGPEGNYEAWQNDSTLAARSVCHDYLIHDKQPIYPERFARIPGVTVAESQAVFSNLLATNQLDANHYALHSDTIKNHILAQPQLFTSFAALNVSQQSEVLNQIAAANAEHKFYSDYNYATISFLKNVCSQSVSIEESSLEPFTFSVFPNPAEGILHFKTNLKEANQGLFSLKDVSGKQLKTWKIMETLSEGTLDLSEVASGIYILELITDGQSSFSQKIILE